MIKVKSISLNPATMEADVFLMADTKEEVQSATTKDYVGFPQKYTVEFGSKVLTTKGELAFMKSDGTWNWGD